MILLIFLKDQALKGLTQTLSTCVKRRILAIFRSPCHLQSNILCNPDLTNSNVLTPTLNSVFSLSHPWEDYKYSQIYIIKLTMFNPPPQKPHNSSLQKYISIPYPILAKGLTA